jgi:hypothetical protein
MYSSGPIILAKGGYIKHDIQKGYNGVSNNLLIKTTVQ